MTYAQSSNLLSILGGVSVSEQKPRLLDQVRDRLRVKDVEFERREILVRDGKEEVRHAA